MFIPGVHKSVPDLGHINKLSKWSALNLGQYIARWAKLLQNLLMLSTGKETKGLFLNMRNMNENNLPLFGNKRSLFSNKGRLLRKSLFLCFWSPLQADWQSPSSGLPERYKGTISPLEGNRFFLFAHNDVRHLYNIGSIHDTVAVHVTNKTI